MTTFSLTAKPLNAENFGSYGQVIELTNKKPRQINQGNTEKFTDLAAIDVATNQGSACLSLYRSKPIKLPYRIRQMECHPLGSQTFIPAHKIPFLIVVAAPAAKINQDEIRAFISNGQQGINFNRGVWHHYQLSLQTVCDYWVIDRAGPGENCLEAQFDQEVWISGYQSIE